MTSIRQSVRSIGRVLTLQSGHKPWGSSVQNRGFASTSDLEDLEDVTAKPSQPRRWPKDKDGFPVKTATAKKLGISTSPHKLNLVARLIRGMSVDEAHRQLSVLLKKHRAEVADTVRAAVTNARSFGMKEDRLIVSKAFVNKGAYLPRMRPWHGKGRFGIEHKKYAHVCIEVQELSDEVWEAKVLPQYVHLRFRPEQEKPRRVPENLVKPWLVRSQLDDSLAETKRRMEMASSSSHSNANSATATSVATAT